MVTLPKEYTRQRLRTIMAYKYIDASYELDTPELKPILFLPVDAAFLKIMNFKLNSDLPNNQKFNLLSVGTDLNNVDVLSNDTALWYETVDRGQIFDTTLDAYSVNTKFHRPESYKEYFNRRDTEGLYVYIDSPIEISNISIYMIFEDLDSTR